MTKSLGELSRLPWYSETSTVRVPFGFNLYVCIGGGGVGGWERDGWRHIVFLLVLAIGVCVGYAMRLTTNWLALSWLTWPLHVRHVHSSLDLQLWDRWLDRLILYVLNNKSVSQSVTRSLKKATRRRVEEDKYAWQYADIVGDGHYIPYLEWWECRNEEDRYNSPISVIVIDCV